MSQHFIDIAKLKSRTSSKDFAPKDNDKQLCLDITLHIADISNTTK